MAFIILLVISEAIFCDEAIHLLPGNIQSNHVRSNAEPDFVNNIDAYLYVNEADIASGGSVKSPFVVIGDSSGVELWKSTSATSNYYPTWGEDVIFENIQYSFFGDLCFKLYSKNGSADYLVAHGCADFSKIGYPISTDDSAMKFYNLTMVKDTNDANLIFGVIAVCTLTACGSRTPKSSSCSSDLDSSYDTCYKVGSRCSLCSGTTCSSCLSEDACDSNSSFCEWWGDSCSEWRDSFCSSITCYDCMDSYSCSDVGCTWNSTTAVCLDGELEKTITNAFKLFWFLVIGVPIIFLVIVAASIVACCCCCLRSRSPKSDGYSVAPDKVSRAYPPQQPVQMVYPAQQTQTGYPVQQIQAGYPAQQAQGAGYAMVQQARV